MSDLREAALMVFAACAIGGAVVLIALGHPEASWPLLIFACMAPPSNRAWWGEVFAAALAVICVVHMLTGGA